MQILSPGQKLEIARRVLQTRDRYGRSVAICTVAGIDITAAQVRHRAARAYRRHSPD